MKKKNGFFMIEVIISIVIITGVFIVLFKVKDNSILLTSKLDNKNIDASLLTLFIPYSQKNENKLSTLVDIYDFKNKQLEEKIGAFEGTNKVTKINELAENKINNTFNLLPKKTVIKYNKYQKVFYSFWVD